MKKENFDSLLEFVKRLPKTETHLHLEGSYPIELLKKYQLIFDEDGYRPPWMEPQFKFESFEQFLGLFARYSRPLFSSVERYYEAASGVLDTCSKQNVRYVELSFHLSALSFSGLDGRAVTRAIRAAAPQGMELRVFAGLCRDAFHDPKTRKMVEAALEWDELDGLDLHGPEELPLEPWTAEIWRRAREAGKVTKAHAGELMPASFIWKVIEDLGVKRIEHGVRAVEDKKLIRFLVENEIALDICPTSNVKLGVKGIPSMSAHPIRKLLDDGVICTLSTDDSLFFNNSINQEYCALHTELGLTPLELARLAKNGFHVALVDDVKKHNFFSEVEAALSAYIDCMA